MGLSGLQLCFLLYRSWIQRDGVKGSRHQFFHSGLNFLFQHLLLEANTSSKDREPKLFDGKLHNGIRSH